MTDTALRAETEVDVAAVMTGLDCHWSILPEESLRTIQLHREQFIPALIEAIRSAVARVRAGEGVDGSQHFFALFLLTEFRATEALPAIMDLLSLSGEAIDSLYSDDWGEFMPHALAVMSGDQPELIDAFIRDTQIDEMNRWQAIDSIAFLVRDGVIPREAATARLTALLQHAVEHGDNVLVEVLIMTLGNIGGFEAREIARDAWDRHEEENFTSWERVEEDFAAAESGEFPELERLKPTELGDTIAYMREWDSYGESEDDSFDDVEEVDEMQVALWKAMMARLDDESTQPSDAPERLEPIRIDRKVGRNEPCPCGSGKKYKKCCGGH